MAGVRCRLQRLLRFVHAHRARTSRRTGAVADVGDGLAHPVSQLDDLDLPLTVFLPSLQRVDAATDGHHQPDVLRDDDGLADLVRHLLRLSDDPAAR